VCACVLGGGLTCTYVWGGGFRSKSQSVGNRLARFDRDLCEFEYVYLCACVYMCVGVRVRVCACVCVYFNVYTYVDVHA